MKTAEKSSFLKELTAKDLHKLSPADLKNSLVTEYDSKNENSWDDNQVIFVQHVRPKLKPKVFQKNSMHLNLEDKEKTVKATFPGNDSLENTLTPMYVPSPFENDKNDHTISGGNYHFHPNDNLAGGDNHIEIRDGLQINHATHDVINLQPENNDEMPKRKTFKNF